MLLCLALCIYSRCNLSFFWQNEVKYTYIIHMVSKPLLFLYRFKLFFAFPVLTDLQGLIQQLLSFTRSNFWQVFQAISNFGSKFVRVNHSFQSYPSHTLSFFSNHYSFLAKTIIIGCFVLLLANSFSVQIQKEGKTSFFVFQVVFEP